MAEITPTSRAAAPRVGWGDAEGQLNLSEVGFGPLPADLGEMGCRGQVLSVPDVPRAAGLAQLWAAHRERLLLPR